MHVTYALSTRVYLHILIVLFRIVPGFCDETLDLLGSNPINERVKGQSNKLLLTGC
jgi:hypothetical protein